MIDWTPYFESICEKYAQWWDVYTLTDVEGKIRQQKTAPLLMDLWMQTVERERDQAGNREEKTERLTVLEGLQKYAANHVLLSGRPGSGKSTALVQLLSVESEWVQGLRPEQGNPSTITQVPILIEFRYYQTSIFDLILQFLQRHELIIDGKTLENLLMGQATVLPLLLFDGINELPSEDARRDLQLFRERYRKIPMIFTTRDLGIGGDLQIEKKLEMLPLNDSQMREFVRAYLPEKGEQMLRQLGDRLKEFGQTPLLLWMLCSVFESNESQIPANLGLVFRQFTEIYDRKLKADVATYQESREWWRQLLQVLAWKMTQGESKTEIRIAIGQREAEAAITAFVREKGFPEFYGKKWLKDLLRHHLIQLESNAQIIFRHQMIQEYYAAEALLEKLPDLSDEELRWNYLNYLNWTETIALMLGMVDREEQAQRVVRLGLEVDLQLGARLAGEVEAKWQQETLSLILERNLPQLFTIRLLRLTRSYAAISELEKALKDPDHTVRWLAVHSLEYINSEAAIPILIKSLEQSELAIRHRAIEALIRIDSETVIIELIKALEHPKSDVCVNAIKILVEIGTKTVVLRLIEALEHSKSDVRINAAAALGEIRSEEAIAGLIKALEHSESDVRVKAAVVLGRIGSEEAIAGLIKASNHSNLDIRVNAAAALIRIDTATPLSNINSELAISDSVQASKKLISDRSTKAITVAQSNIKSKAPISELLKDLKSPDFYVRIIASEALGIIGSEAAISGLIEALETPDIIVLESIVDALSKIGSDLAIVLLINCLKNPDWVILNEGDTFFQSLEALDAIQNKLKYYRPPQPIHPSLASPTHPESKNININNAQYVQIIEKGNGKIQNNS